MNRILSFMLLLPFCFYMAAQEKTVLTIGDNHYSLDEFNYIYEKNNTLTQEPMSRQQYLELFVNYKLKVVEAMQQGFDTLTSFKDELNYYRNELAKPYLNDKKAIDEVVREAYEHSLYEVEASHILIKFPASPTPEDTLKAYTTIASIKKQLNEGADFVSMAKKYSQCPSAQQSDGHLGYFGAFMMVYPFEKAAYNTPVGSVSDITRTSFGYHLIKVHNKRKNKGEIKVAHIMRSFPYQADEAVRQQAKVMIDSVYRQLQAGASFEDMVVKYSDDRQTLDAKGELPWFGTGRMVPAFSDAAFALKTNGQMSKPVMTRFGWHIIKRLDVRPVKPLEEAREEILQKIKRDERAFAGKKATLERLKNEYDYRVNEEALKKVEMFLGKYGLDYDDASFKANGVSNLKLASFDDQVVNANDFMHYATMHSGGRPEETKTGRITQLWNSYADDVLINYEKSRLEERYPDFRFLMQEYHDGLLIFEISQKEIWTKASEDSVGLAAYYENHKEQYRADEYFKGRLLYCKSKTVYKKLKKMLRKNTGLSLDSLDQEMREGILEKKGPFLKGEEPKLDALVWKSKGKVIDADYPYAVPDGEIVPSHIQPLDVVRGRVISDYQEALEKQWVERLRNKYKPQVNTFVFQ
ncbi:MULTISPECIES: peptidylprolyl isomerase [unclassified Carboxylicivirga]|uniref:peptidylprolyl isomerase n=1 Tax=Carboxylicivirga TaxID=1628153 RepID=UPI003D3573B8